MAEDDNKNTITNNQEIGGLSQDYSELFDEIAALNAQDSKAKKKPGRLSKIFGFGKKEEAQKLEKSQEKSYVNPVFEKALNSLPKERDLTAVSELFKIFGDPTRIKILSSLLGGELCVGDICKVVNMNQSAVSHQLRTLKDSNLIAYRRIGKSIFYSLADNHVKTILEIGLEHVQE